MALITLIVKTFDRDDQTDSKIHQQCTYLQKWRHTQCALLFRVLWDTCGDFVYISNKCFFCLKNKLKIPNRPHTLNNCSELRKSYKQHGYLDKNNSRHTVNFFPFSRHTIWTFHATRLTPLRPSVLCVASSTACINESITINGAFKLKSPCRLSLVQMAF